jgi:hypothetical protein
MKTAVECLRMLAFLIGLAFLLVNAIPNAGFRIQDSGISIPDSSPP